MLLLNIDYVPGKEIEPLGMVKGTVVQSKNIGRDFMAGMKTLVGGEIVDVDQEPYYVLSASGDWIEDTTHTTLLFTVETTTPTAEVMTTQVGEQEVRIGKTDYILKSEYIEFSDGVIVDVIWGDGTTPAA